MHPDLLTPAFVACSATPPAVVLQAINGGVHEKAWVRGYRHARYDNAKMYGERLSSVLNKAGYM